MGSSGTRGRGLRYLATGLFSIYATLSCDSAGMERESPHEDHGVEHHDEQGSKSAGGHAQDEEGEAGHGHAGEAGEEQGDHEDHGDEVTLTGETVKQHGIVIQKAGRQILDHGFMAPARVSFNMEAMAHVGTPVEGRVTELEVKLGDLVERGGILLVIDSPALGEAQSDLLQKASAVKVARTRLEFARATYERSRNLLEGKGLSLGEFQRREGEFRIAEGEVLAAEAAATAAENRLHLYGMSQSDVERLVAGGEVDSRFRVRAPIAGRVVEREVTLGEVVGPDREALLVLADLTTLWILADVPEGRVPQITVGAPARALIGALEEAPIEGKIAYVSPEIDPETRTASVRVDVTDPPSGLRPGMFGQVELANRSEDQEQAGVGLVVPESAVQTVEGTTAVFVTVPGEEHTFARRAVTLGPRVGNFFPVLSGLSEGEAFVSSGSFILKAELGKAGAAHEH